MALDVKKVGQAWSLGQIINRINSDMFKDCSRGWYFDVFPASCAGDKIG